MTSEQIFNETTRAANALEDKELIAEMQGAYRAYNAYHREGNIEKAEWFRSYYWAIKAQISHRWR